MDIGNALASLVSNSSSLNASLNNSIGVAIPDVVEINGDNVRIQIGSLIFEAVPVLNLSKKLSPLPSNLQGNLIVLYVNGSSQAPVAVFTSTPVYNSRPEVSNYAGTVIVGELIYYSAGSGLIPLAPYRHKHVSGKATQGQDTGGDFQQTAQIIIVEDTRWELNF